MTVQMIGQPKGRQLLIMEADLHLASTISDIT